VSGGNLKEPSGPIQELSSKELPSQKLPAQELTKGLGLYDSIMIVAGSMIGSAIFIVTADMSRQLGSAGWVMVSWLIAGFLTVTGALAYGELATMMPRAGGQYVYLRESFSPMVGFLYGWTLFLVIQTGTVAAVAVAFARYLGVFLPTISEAHYLISPIQLLPGYAISLSTAQAVAIAVLALLTVSNMRGLNYGKIVQNVFTQSKIVALAALVGVGIYVGSKGQVLRENFAHAWHPQGVVEIVPGLTALTAVGMFVAICVSQVSSMFAADAWNNITFTAGEVRNPRRNVPLSLAIGAGGVIILYMLVNLAYFAVLPIVQVQHAPSDRVATAMLQAVFPGFGTLAVAVLIMVSTFGCINGILLAGSRAYLAMARDGLFFSRAAKLNKVHVPGWALLAQGVWAAFLVLPRTYNSTTHAYGNLYSNLLDYVISAALLFYVLTIIGLFRLRRKFPLAERPYRAFGYPFLPALYIVGTTVLLAVLLVYRTSTTVPGFVLVALGIPVYLLLKRRLTPEQIRSQEEVSLSR
jgi:basic amino acid/polyamine antiporter, APA family